MKPRIFVSSVSRELKSTRQLVANTLLALGHEPFWQDIFETSGDDIRPMLRKHIDSCSAVFQIVGDAYGAEPPNPDDTFGRVSYTQYEALYAKAQGKKVYYLIAREDMPRDTTHELIDTPGDDSDSAQADAVKRRRLQQLYRERVLVDETVYYPVSNHPETELTVRRLRDELEELRREFRDWMNDVSGQLAQVKDYIINPVRIREQIEIMIQKTFHDAIRAAELLTEWEKRAVAKQAAEQQRDQSLSRVKEFLESIVEAAQSDFATKESKELARILDEQGAEEALAYIQSEQSRLLSEADRLIERRSHDSDRLRATLSPILEGARLLANKSDYEGARQDCTLILMKDPAWADALHVQFWNLIELADRALRYDSISCAETLYRESDSIAHRLVRSHEPHAQAQRDLSISHNRLGNVLLQMGQPQEALAHYESGLKISEKLAAGDPRDAQAQRDLSISHNNLGDVLLQMGQPQEALAHYESGLKISEKLAAGDPRDAQAQRDLSISHNNLGDVLLQMGQPQEALAHYESGLKISEKLAAGDPRDAQAQRDLSISHNRLGNVLLQMGQPQEALAHYESYLQISEKLAAGDPRDAQAQRDLSVSHNKLGDVLLQMGQPQEALAHYESYLQISEKLAAGDPRDAQAQRDLSISHNKLGNVLLQMGQPQEALAHYESYLQISEKLAAGDPRDAQAQRDLSVSHNKLGDVLLQMGQPQEALAHYESYLQISEKLAAGDPRDAQAQRDLSISHNKLGNVLLQMGQPQEALAHYESGLKISEKLAAGDSRDAQAQRDLMFSYYKLGSVHQQLNEIAIAKSNYQAGIAVLDRMISAGMNVEVSRKDKAVLEKRIAACDSSESASK